MQLKGIIFSTEEMEEIELLKELCENMTVDGVEIVCFKVLSDLLNNRVRFEDISKEVLQITQLQMNDYVHFWSDIDWYDSRMVESVSMKFGKLLGN
ncbi:MULTISPECIES: hypothetical protein [unclassified Paenibacillus]|uniref:hypothetical protein n=1 Tax=unclassified Paenibacillus TaxID=185978 RepID=UPI00020D7645|nr:MULTISPECIES: hypothetical protein [unclassified Paenibacillus]EGL15035.1 hypothetical protein HMPREF9413_2059 [Paenibacillus sp. HGF7]EPD82208.1 hypothetical protein HMPREF1207_04034 [Paenibacillus sp. HGH0039]